MIRVPALQLAVVFNSSELAKQLTLLKRLKYVEKGKFVILASLDFFS